MYKKIKQVIPWLSFLAIAMAALLLIEFNMRRSAILVESPETKATAEDVIKKILATNPKSLDDQSLIEALEEADNTPYIAQVWLFTPDGQLKFSRGTPKNFVSAQQLVTRQVVGALAALPEGTLNQGQQMLVIIASAIQAEGEHNDVYRYKVQQIISPDNQVVGYIGITYDVNDGISADPTIWTIVSTFGLLLSLVIYWVGLATWTYLDAKERNEKAGVWALFVLIGNLVALIAYLLVRGQSKNI
jgi:hypothetical protein